ncbi:MAG: hypothetical protein ACREDL_08395, partial [Bradyrhizobium sp.]
WIALLILALIVAGLNRGPMDRGTAAVIWLLAAAAGIELGYGWYVAAIAVVAAAGGILNHHLRRRSAVPPA